MAALKKFKKAKDITVGVVGYGGAFNMGRSHLNEMKQAGMTPVAVCELDPARLEVAKEDFPGIEAYSSVAEMLKKSKVNIVTIITPHNTHAKLAIQCLKAGKHVVCEKPFAVTTDECDKMIAEAKKRGLLVTAYHNRHWDGNIMHALKTVKSGAIGDIVRVEAHMGRWGLPGDWWRTSRSISGGILYDWGVHLLEYSFQLIDSPITEISGFAKNGFWAAKTKWKNDTNEDEGFLTVRFKSGQWLSLCITSIDSNPKKGSLEITGTKGSYVMEYDAYSLITHKDGDKVVQSGKTGPSMWPKFYKNIADHLTKGTKLVITPEWSRKPIHVIDLGVKSAKQGKAMKPKYT